MKVLTPNTPQIQVIIMVFMNSKGKTYHPSIVMVKLNVLHNTNGKVSWIPGNYTARGVILCHKTGKFKMIVL